MITAVTFKDGRAFFRNRFVRTKGATGEGQVEGGLMVAPVGRAHVPSLPFVLRVAHSPGYDEELRAKKILYRGTFGTQKEGGWLANIFDLRRKNVANTNVIYWAGKLLALWEGGLPHTMDPITLQTFRESRLGRVRTDPRDDDVTDTDAHTLSVLVA